MEQNKTIVYENIDGTDGRYRWKKYLNIRVIEDTTNGYINATKLCAMYGKTKTGGAKKFCQWKHNNRSFIDSVSSCIHQTAEEIVPQAYVMVVGIATLRKQIDAMVIQNIGLKVQTDALKVQTDTLKVQTDALKVQTDALKVQTDTLKIKSNGLHSTLHNVLNTVTSIEDLVAFKAD